MLRLVALFALCALLAETTTASAMPNGPKRVVPAGATYVIYSRGKMIKRLRAGSNVTAQLPKGLLVSRCRPIPCVPIVILQFCYDCY